MTVISIKKIFKGSLWVVLTTIITRLAGFIVLPILARLLGASDLGLYNLIQNTVQTGDGLSRLGTDAALHRNGSQYQTIGIKAVGRLFGVGASISILASVIVALTLWLYQGIIALNWLGEPKTEEWLSLTAITILLIGIANPSWFFLVALQAFKIYSIRNSTVTILGSLITIIFAWQFGLAGAIWGLCITALMQVIFGWSLTLPILREKNIKLSLANYTSESRSILSFGLPFYASNFLSSFIALPLLGYVSRSGGIEQLGYLRVAQSMSQFITFLPTAIAPVIISNLSASISSDVNNYKKLKSLHLRVLWLFIIIVAATISLSLDYIIPTLFGSEFSQAIILSQIAIWNAAISSLSGIFGQYVTSSGDTRKIAIIQIIGLTINLVLALLLVPRYSSMGLLLSQGISSISIFLLYYKPALHDLNTIDKKSILVLSFFSMFLISMLLILTSIFNGRIIKIIAFACVIILSVAVLIANIFTKNERIMATRVIKNKLDHYK